MNQSPMLARFVRETDIDAILLAGRYTLLDQEALADLLPACVERGVAVLAAGVMNSGVLADPRPGARVQLHARRRPDVVERARGLREACERHGVPVRAAAMQFPLAHPAVAGLIAGVRTPAHLDEYPAMLRLPIPAALWDDLRGVRPHRCRRAGAGMTTPVVDAHHHLWDPARAVYPWMTACAGPDPAPVRRRGPDPVARCGRHRCEHPRPDRSRRRRRAASSSRRPTATPRIAGVIAWTDLTSPGVADDIAALEAAPGGDRLVGIRHQVHDEDDPDWLRRSDVRRGLVAVEQAGLPYDLLVRSRELPAALETVRELPDLRFVIDHLAKPPIRDGAMSPWAERLEPFGALPNVELQAVGHGHRGRLVELDRR